MLIVNEQLEDCRRKQRQKSDKQEENQQNTILNISRGGSILRSIKVQTLLIGAYKEGPMVLIPSHLFDLISTILLLVCFYYLNMSYPFLPRTYLFGDPFAGMSFLQFRCHLREEQPPLHFLQQDGCQTLSNFEFHYTIKIKFGPQIQFQIKYLGNMKEN